MPHSHESLETTKFPSIGEWLYKFQCHREIEYYVTIKKNGLELGRDEKGSALYPTTTAGGRATVSRGAGCTGKRGHVDDCVGRWVD